jgi:hypothetical protein
MMATSAEVGGMVESQRMPMTEPKFSVATGLGGYKMNARIAIDRLK